MQPDEVRHAQIAVPGTPPDAGEAGAAVGTADGMGADGGQSAAGADDDSNPFN